MPHSESAGQVSDRRQRLVLLAGQCTGGQASVESLVAECDEMLRGIPLYPPGELFETGIAVGEVLEKSPPSAIEIALRLVSSDVRETRALAVAVVHRLARLQPGLWVDTAQHLLSDNDWEVRDLAAHVFDVFEDQDGAAEFHLPFVTEVVGKWIHDGEERIRRAAPQALLGYALRHEEFRPQLLSLLDPLLDDEQEYVRNSYVACLRVLGRADPALVLNYIERALEQADRKTAEVVRQVLEHPFADRFPEQKARIAQRLPNFLSPESE